MATLKVVREGETIPLQVEDEMLRATDAQILGFATETLNKEFREDEFTVERTAEGLMIHPTATYG